MTRDEAQAWARRWRAVNEFQRQEARNATPEERVRQFFSLLRLAQAMKWEGKLREGDDEACDNWRRIREAYRAEKEQA